MNKRLWLAADDIHPPCLIEAINESVALQVARTLARFTNPFLLHVRDVGPGIMPKFAGAGRPKKQNEDRPILSEHLVAPEKGPAVD